MKALSVLQPGVIELVDLEDPVPAPGWARIQVRVAAICMTDFEILRGSIAVRLPLTPGHEWSGVVSAVGSASDRAWVGRRVVGHNEITCLECVFCRRGEWRRCHRYRQIGFQAHGAYAESLLAPVVNLIEIPESISFEQGALLEPLGVGLAVAKMSDALLGSTALILGVGPIGLNCLAVLKASGASRILCLDLRKRRLELAQSWGAAATIEDAGELMKAVERWRPEGVDLVVDTTGNDAIIRLGLAAARFGGAFVLAGYCGGRSMEIKPDLIHLRNLRFLGAGNNSGFTAPAAQCVADGILRTEEMITRRYALEEYAAAFSLDTVRMPDYIKGVFVFDA